MISQCVLFFFAAFENTSSIISLALYSLAADPIAQNQLYEEVLTELESLRVSKSDGEKRKEDRLSLKLITIESLSTGFKYLAAVLDETLRLYPPNSTSRTANKDILLTVSDANGQIATQLDIRKGDVVHLPIYAIHHDFRSFEDAELFKPERFLGTQSFHRYAFLPFGTGPRSCVAESLARVEAKLAIASIIYWYKLSVSPQTDAPIKFYNNGQTLSPKAVKLHVSKRN